METVTDDNPPRVIEKMKLRRIYRFLKPIVPLGIAFFIGRVIYENWRHVRDAPWDFEERHLFFSFLLTAGWYVLRPLVWKVILQCFGHGISWGAAYRTFRQAELSRYVPGGVWQYVSRVYLAGNWGVPAAATMAATLVETVMLILAAVPPASFSFSEALPNLARFQIILLILFPLGAAVVLHPRSLNLWAGFLARKLRQPYSRLEIQWPAVVGVWLVYVLMWLACCLGIGFFVRGVITIPTEQVPSVGSFYAAAWIIAILSVVAPAGMGIRDGVFGLLLSQIMPLGAALTVAVATRIWMTLSELLWAGVGLWFCPNPRAGPREE